jgi:hypothetical protein
MKSRPSNSIVLSGKTRTSTLLPVGAFAVKAKVQTVFLHSDIDANRHDSISQLQHVMCKKEELKSEVVYGGIEAGD